MKSEEKRCPWSRVVIVTRRSDLYVCSTFGFLWTLSDSFWVVQFLWASYQQHRDADCIKSQPVLNPNIQGRHVSDTESPQSPGRWFSETSSTSVYRSFGQTSCLLWRLILCCIFFIGRSLLLLIDRWWPLLTNVNINVFYIDIQEIIKSVKVRRLQVKSRVLKSKTCFKSFKISSLKSWSQMTWWLGPLLDWIQRTKKEHFCRLDKQQLFHPADTRQRLC